MSYPPTTLTVSYGSSSTASLNIPSGSNASDYVQAMYRAGGFWTVQNVAASQPETQNFIPWSQITEIAAS